MASAPQRSTSHGSAATQPTSTPNSMTTARQPNASLGTYHSRGTRTPVGRTRPWTYVTPGGTAVADISYLPGPKASAGSAGLTCRLLTVIFCAVVPPTIDRRACGT